MKGTYQELERLPKEEGGSVFLMRQRETGLLVLGQIVRENMFPVYAEIQKIRHPNLMKIFEVEWKPDGCRVIAEYIDGESLRDVLRREGQFEEKKAAECLLSLCKAVCALHEQGIIHCDINPSNIMITRDGILKLCDYDISCFVKKKRTREKKVFGTVGYAPPEQFGYGQVNVQSDIYAMGVLAGVMLTGEEGGSLQRPKEESPFSEIVSRMISLTKEERYETAKVLLKDLEILLQKEEHEAMGELSLFFPGIRRAASRVEPVGKLFFYIFVSLVQCAVLARKEEPSDCVFWFSILAWLFFFDFQHLSQWLLKMTDGQRWFRYVFGLALLLAAGLI